jgi:putative serine protease PepD
MTQSTDLRTTPSQPGEGPAPWWSLPVPERGPDFTLPPQDPTPPGDLDEPRDPGRRRRTVAGLLALVLASGASGGAVASQWSHSAAPTAVTPTGAVLRSTGGLTGSTVSSGTTEAAAAVIGPSVVTVEVSGSETVIGGGFFGGQQTQQVSDTGSGVVVRSDGATGYILTNNHVIAAALNGGSVHVTLNDGRTVVASIVGHDTTDDLAVLKVTGVNGLKAATFADSEQLKVGQAVLAVGAPLGLSNTVTQGIVSTLHRPVATGEAGAGAQAVIDAVQTDAAINPGNSGGALVDLAGRVVGINSAIASTGSSSGQSGNIGVGFAIPSNDAADVADQLIRTGHATHAQLGVSAGDATSGTDGAPGLGALLRVVTPGGPAAKAGLQAGDLVTKIGLRLVTDANSLIVATRAHDPGAAVAVTYTRAGQVRQTSVTLAGAPSD